YSTKRLRSPIPEIFNEAFGEENNSEQQSLVLRISWTAKHLVKLVGPLGQRVMSQQEPSKRNKKEKKKKTFAKPGSLSFLANKKRRLLTTNEIAQAIECEK
ncbi:hypothetical protein H5410_022783, partial [Solanum commersonii]